MDPATVGREDAVTKKHCGREIASSPPELDRILEWNYKYLQYEEKTSGREPNRPRGTVTIQTTNDPETYRGMEPRPRITVVVVTHNTERDSLRGCGDTMG